MACNMDVRIFDPFENYDFGKCLGSGAGGKVYAATCKRKGVQVAIKQIPVSEAEHRSEALKEVSVMVAMDHPNIIKLLEAYEWDRHIFLVMEHLSGGDLLDRIEDKGSLQEHEVQKIVSQLADALRHAHERGIAHRDVKPENICFTHKDQHDLEVKLIDWGLAEDFTRFEGGAMHQEVGSCNYAAPEVLEVAFGMRPGGYSCACDVWSLGAVAYEMVCGQNPFWGELNSMMSELLPFEEEQWTTVSPDCKDFMRQLLRAQAENRLTIRYMCQHAFLVDVKPSAKQSYTTAPAMHQQQQWTQMRLLLRKVQDEFGGERQVAKNTWSSKTAVTRTMVKVPSQCKLRRQRLKGKPWNHFRAC
jgi:serine/threonine protein kinase